MKHFNVQSSQISSVAHEPRTGMMQIKFNHGGLYEYGRVSDEQFRAMVMADSIGSHFSKHFKNNKNHPCNKVDSSVD